MALRNGTAAKHCSNSKDTKDKSSMSNTENTKSGHHVNTTSPTDICNGNSDHHTGKDSKSKSLNPVQKTDRVMKSPSALPHYANGETHVNGVAATNGDDNLYTSNGDNNGHLENGFSPASCHNFSPKQKDGAFSDRIHSNHLEETSHPYNNIEKSHTSVTCSPVPLVSPSCPQKQTNGVPKFVSNGRPKTESCHHQQPQRSLELTIPKYYAGKNIFLTGATGFMGKVFIEKMLRSCPDVAAVYCLVRPKKGQTVQERMSDIVDSKLCDTLRKIQPDFDSKIHLVEGDIVLPNMGLSDDDQKMLEGKIHLVFHSAATVRFDEPLRKAMELNVLSVRKMIVLCRKFQHMEAFVHVSTAYANCDLSYIEEKVYPPPVEPQKIIDVLSWMDDEMVELFTPKLLGDKPNTYTYTKQLAEHLLLTEAADLPVAIVRPSIVGAAWKEPVPGWIDNYNGPSGIYIAAGKGVLRWMIADVNAKADIIPVDIPINVMIAAGWYTGVAKPKDIIIYHATTGNDNPLRWGQMEPIVNKFFNHTPLEKCFRRPNVFLLNSGFHLDYWKIVSHMFPAYICDMAFALVGKKPQMVKMYNRLHRSIECLQFFTCNEWRWDTANHEMLRRQLTPEDLKTFYVDLRPLHWPTYIENYCMGAKTFILNEDMSRLPAARAHIRRLRIIRTLFNSAICVVLWRVLIAKSQFARNLWFFIVNLVFKFVRYFRITSTIHK